MHHLGEGGAGPEPVVMKGLNGKEIKLRGMRGLSEKERKCRVCFAVAMCPSLYNYALLCHLCETEKHNQASRHVLC